MFNTLVVIPAHNEEKNIGRVLSDIEKMNLEVDLLVVNDGSSDNTAEAARKSGANVVSLPYNLGYGGALQTGFKYAVSRGYTHIIQFDGDGQHDPEDIGIILEKLKSGEADIVIGSRFMGKGSFPIGFMKKTAIMLFRFLIKFTTGARITDPTSGLQGLTRRVFSYYSMKGNFPGDYPDADILIHMIRCKYRVHEFPANIRPRIAGRSMHAGLKPLYYFIKVLLSILIVIMREKILKEGCEYNG
mgnify:CR=1 FL=1